MANPFLRLIPKTVLDRYIMQQLLLYSAFVLLIFTVVWIAPEILLESIQYISEGRLSIGSGLLMILYRLPEVLAYCVPITAMLATLFFFRRFSLSSELIAVQASGISLRRLLLPVALVGGILSILVFMNQEIFAPLCAQGYRTIRSANHLDGKEAAQNYLTMSESYESGALKNFRLFSDKPVSGEGDLGFLSVEMASEGTDKEKEVKTEAWIERILFSESAVWDKKAAEWRLTKANDYHLSPEGIYKDFVLHEKLVIPSPSQLPIEQYTAFAKRLPIEMTTFQLLQRIDVLRLMGQADQAQYYWVRFFQRLIQPFAPLVLALITVGFAVERTRSKWNIGLAVAAILLIFYNVSISVMMSLGSAGILPAVIAAAMPLILVTLLAEGAKRLRQRLA